MARRHRDLLGYCVTYHGQIAAMVADERFGYFRATPEEKTLAPAELPRLVGELFGGREVDGLPVHLAYERAEAMAWLARQWLVPCADPSGLEDQTLRVPDAEKDRIVVWMVFRSYCPEAVWHYSGWHFEQNASDLPGGPLRQGRLPGDECTLLTHANR